VPVGERVLLFLAACTAKKGVAPLLKLEVWGRNAPERLVAGGGRTGSRCLRSAGMVGAISIAGLPLGALVLLRKEGVWRQLQLRACRR